jgi:Rrf2 family iron-sulfur cluster assembly transcriptional regulator
MSRKNTVKLTTRGRYAVMAMVAMAGQSQSPPQQTAPIPLSHIAQAGDISLSYLEQLFSGLRRHGLVQSFRGPGGGYILARPVTEIMIADILISAEDCAPAKRVSAEDSTDKNPRTQALWDNIGEILYICLRHVSLADVMNGKLGSHPALNKMFDTAA